MKLTRLLALLATLVVALPVSGLGRELLFCRAMDRVVGACCCKHNASVERDAPRGPRAERSPCCVRFEGSDRSAPSAVREGTISDHAQALSALAPAIELLPAPPNATLATSGVQARAPPHTGPPLFIEHCSLLI
jgi:hypothetical protein